MPWRARPQILAGWAVLILLAHLLFAQLTLVLALAFTVTGPRLLGDATNVIFAGVLGAHLPAGVTQAQAAVTRPRRGGLAGTAWRARPGIDPIPGTP